MSLFSHFARSLCPHSSCNTPFSSSTSFNRGLRQPKWCAPPVGTYDDPRCAMELLKRIHWIQEGAPSESPPFASPPRVGKTPLQVGWCVCIYGAIPYLHDQIYAQYMHNKIYAHKIYGMRRIASNTLAGDIIFVYAQKYVNPI